MGTGTSKETDQAKEALKKEAIFLYAADGHNQLSLQDLKADYPFKLLTSVVYEDGKPACLSHYWNGEYLLQTSHPGLQQQSSKKVPSTMDIRCLAQGFHFLMGEVSFTPTPATTHGAKCWEDGTILMVAQQINDNAMVQVSSLVSWLIPWPMDGHPCSLALHTPSMNCTVLLALQEDMEASSVYSFPTIPQKWLKKKVTLTIGNDTCSFSNNPLVEQTQPVHCIKIVTQLDADAGSDSSGEDEAQMSYGVPTDMETLGEESGWISKQQQKTDPTIQDASSEADEEAKALPGMADAIVLDDIKFINGVILGVLNQPWLHSCTCTLWDSQTIEGRVTVQIEH